jgi:hypothetical protein
MTSDKVQSTPSQLTATQGKDVTESKVVAISFFMTVAHRPTHEHAEGAKRFP